MSQIYDNWERLVAAAVKKQQLWELFHQQSRSPSIRSEASDFSSSFNSSIHDVAFDISSPGSSSRWQEAFAKLHPKLVSVSDFNPSFDVEDVFLASSELLWSGNFGSVYKVVMVNGITIVVKRLKLGIISEMEFKRNMEIVGNVKHENVVPLRAYYSSEDERLTLYDYHAKGSVSILLHGKTGRNSAPVDWETRLRIAMGAARGIAEIHAQNGGKFVHGNIKASNVFINSQLYGCVSDLGLASMIATKFLPTALCYPPEFKNNTQNISQASDAYSFGILLLELLTRKSPVHIPGGPLAVDLVKLVTSVKSKEWAVKVFDADLLKNPAIKDEMVKLLQIGISLVAKSPKKRPKMSEVVKMIEEISTMSSQIPASMEKKLVFLEDNDPFDLEDMLRASADVLGRGTFGTCYKASFENGERVAVKRLKDATVSLKEFQTQIEVIRSMRHDNVAELRAYYYFQDEKLLVYDYNNQDSLYAMLHGSTGDKKTPLDWDSRLKIASGAARGIAHIHRQEDRNCVHGNIKSSNIFVNGQKYGLVSDAGLAKLTGPIRPSTMRAPHYWAPEVSNTRRASQASDVYSFGVVLLELVTGKPSQLTTNDGKVVSLVEWIKSVVREEWSDVVLDMELLRGVDEEAMVRVLQIGMECVAIVPQRRPKMPEVVNMLDEISGVYYQVDQPSVDSRMECMLEDLLHALVVPAWYREIS